MYFVMLLYCDEYKLIIIRNAAVIIRKVKWLFKAIKLKLLFIKYIDSAVEIIIDIRSNTTRINLL